MTRMKLSFERILAYYLRNHKNTIYIDGDTIIIGFKSVYVKLLDKFHRIREYKFGTLE